MPDIRGVDGCVMAVVGAILRDPVKERTFRDALAANRDGVPPYMAAIMALNTANGAGIPEIDEDSLKRSLAGPVAEYLTRDLGCTLPTHPGIEFTFLDMLAKNAGILMDILKKEYDA